MSIIAIDVGGTKSRFALYDLDGRVLVGFETPSLHPLQVGYQEMAEGLRKAVNEIIAKSNEKIELISFGLAGYGQDSTVRKEIEKAIKDNFSEKHIIHNDVECALMASLHQADGIMLVAGTGSIGLRSLNHQTQRSGGWGYLIGDEGSAYWIGRSVLSHFSKMADGRLDKTELYDVVMDALVLDEASDIISTLYKHPNHKQAIASLAKAANLACEKGDTYANNIFEDAAYELAQIVKSLAYESPSSIPVRCVGGVFEAGELVLNPLKKHLGELYEVELSDNPPIYGAYLYAKLEMGE